MLTSSAARFGKETRVRARAPLLVNATQRSSLLSTPYESRRPVGRPPPHRQPRRRTPRSKRALIDDTDEIETSNIRRKSSDKNFGASHRQRARAQHADEAKRVEELPAANCLRVWWRVIVVGDGVS